jgi:farnesyl-diphosphate farnesyltransferase
MPDSSRSVLLGPLLKSVSRSFYLTLRVLPAGMCDPVGLAYLLARAADTIADTSLIAPEQRMELLLSLRAMVNGVPDQSMLARVEAEVASRQKDSDERVLLASLRSALALLARLTDFDRGAVREIVTTLTTGMEFDLRTFPDEASGHIAALKEYAELDRYTYLVAGCVGEFWTKMTYAHVAAEFRERAETMCKRGIRFGKALQMTNVLRDCAKDLRIGRCYLPTAMLVQAGLAPQNLLQPEASWRARPVLLELVTKALEHYREAVEYTLALPRKCVRLRLACLWPVVIGLETLGRLVSNEHWLDPQKASKIRRSDVYRIMASSAFLVASNGMLRGWLDRLIVRVEGRMQQCQQPRRIG